jgi:STE24 endopeptidase
VKNGEDVRKLWTLACVCCVIAVAVCWLPGVDSASVPGQPTQVIALSSPAPLLHAAAAGDVTRTSVNCFTLSPDDARRVARRRLQHRLLFAGDLCTLVVLGLLLHFGIGPRLRDAARRVSRRWLVQAAICIAPIILVLRLLDLPASLLSDPSIWQWSEPALVKNYAELEAYVFVGQLAALALLYVLIRRAPRGWWMWTALVGVAANFSWHLFEQVILIPKAFGLEPLSATRPDLVREIERISARGGIRIPPANLELATRFRGVNLMAASLGPWRRVVISADATSRLSAPQLLASVGHELGHCAQGVLPGLTVDLALALVQVGLVFAIARWVIRRFGSRWKIASLDDFASLPLLLLAYFAIGFATRPLSMAWRRHCERLADIYGLEVTHGIVPNSAEEFARTLEELATGGDPDPDLLERLYYLDDPPACERIALARAYDPWSQGRSPRFVK